MSLFLSFTSPQIEKETKLPLTKCLPQRSQLYISIQYIDTTIRKKGLGRGKKRNSEFTTFTSEMPKKILQCSRKKMVDPKFGETGPQSWDKAELFFLNVAYFHLPEYMAKYLLTAKTLSLISLHINKYRCTITFCCPVSYYNEPTIIYWVIFAC